jgi:hypothetical protein
MTRPFSADQRADHDRDLRKHEPRASDPLPHRFQVPIEGALEVAIHVKGLKDVREAAKLVEQYARTVSSAERLQASIDRSSYDGRLAVATLIGAVEGMIRTANLGADIELELRRNIAIAEVAFGMPSKVDREQADA